MLESIFTSLNVVLLAALFVSVLFWLHTFFILYHLMRFGIGTRPKQAALIYLIGSITLFFFFILCFVFLALNIPSLMTLLNIQTQ